MTRTQCRTEHLAQRIYKGLGKGHVNCCGSLRCGQDWVQLVIIIIMCVCLCVVCVLLEDVQCFARGVSHSQILLFEEDYFMI